MSLQTHPNQNMVVVTKYVYYHFIFFGMLFWGISILYSPAPTRRYKITTNFLCVESPEFPSLPWCTIPFHYEIPQIPMQRPPYLHTGAMFYQNVTPTYSIIMAVYNQQDIVYDSVASIMNTTLGFYELIIVFDGCWDNSLNAVLPLVRSFRGTRLMLIVQPNAVDETAANNIGMRNAIGDYFILTQPDIFMTEVGWNIQLRNAMLSVPRNSSSPMFSVSGRCAHDLDGSNKVGWCGTDIDNMQPLPLQLSIRETCNRGPLMLDASMTRQLGYLDEIHFFRGDDDHDLNRRAKLKFNAKSGFFPVGFYAPLRLGSTRKSHVKPREIAEYDHRYEKARKELAQTTAPKNKVCFAYIMIYSTKMDDFRKSVASVRQYMGNVEIVVIADAAFPISDDYVLRKIDPNDWTVGKATDYPQTFRLVSAPQHGGFNIDYRKMSRFAAGPFWKYVSDYDLVVKIDADAFLTEPWTENPFKMMSLKHSLFGFWIAYSDLPDVTEKLEETIRKYTVDKTLTIPSLIFDPATSQYRRTNFYGCFIAARPSLFLSPEYKHFFEYIDASGGIFKYRWDEQKMFAIFAAMYLKPGDIHWMKYAKLEHQTWKTPMTIDQLFV